MCKIYFLVEETNIHNSSGINTFLIHLKKIVKEIEVVSLIYTSNYIKIKNGSFKDKGLIIVNDYTSILFLKENLKIIKEYKTLFYTHIGDMLHLYEENINLDFPKEMSLKVIEFIKENNLMIGTQSNKYKKMLSKIFHNNNIFTLYEPLFIKDCIKNSNVIYDYIIISSFYPRKNFCDMLDYLSKYKHKTLILCSNSENLHKELSNRKLNNYVKIISNVDNSVLPFFIKKCKVLLHLAKTEVMPYSVLEANRFIPCIINGNANWGKSIDDIFYGKNIYPIIDTTDFENIEKTFKNIKSFSSEEIKNYNNLNLYQNEFYNQWNNFFKSEVNL